MRRDGERSHGAMSMSVDAAPAPAELALLSVERHNARVGHENAGFLSAARGFVPLTAPLPRLSQRFAAWDELAAELPALHASLELRARVERLPLLDASRARLPANQLLRASAVLAMLAHAYWYVERIVLADNVYDITCFLDRHPGGPTILRAYAGLDASLGFARAHPASRLVARLQRALRIGTVQDPTPQLPAAQAQAYRTLLSALQLVVEMQNALELDLAFTMHAREPRPTPHTRHEQAQLAPSPYELQRERERAARFAREYLAPLTEHALPGLHAALLPLHPFLPPVPKLEAPRVPSDPPTSRLLLRHLKRGLLTALRPLESTDAPDALLAKGWLRCIAALNRHAQKRELRVQCTLC